MHQYEDVVEIAVSGLMSKFETCYHAMEDHLSFPSSLVVAEKMELLMMVHRCLTAVMIKIRLQLVQTSSYINVFYSN